MPRYAYLFLGLTLSACTTENVISPLPVGPISAAAAVGAHAYNATTNTGLNVEVQESSQCARPIPLSQLRFKLVKVPDETIADFYVNKRAFEVKDDRLENGDFKATVIYDFNKKVLAERNVSIRDGKNFLNLRLACLDE